MVTVLLASSYFLLVFLRFCLTLLPITLTCFCCVLHDTPCFQEATPVLQETNKYVGCKQNMMLLVLFISIHITYVHRHVDLILIRGESSTCSTASPKSHYQHNSIQYSAYYLDITWRQCANTETSYTCPNVPWMQEKSRV